MNPTLESSSHRFSESSFHFDNNVIAIPNGEKVLFYNTRNKNQRDLSRSALEIIYLDLVTLGKSSRFTSSVYGVTIFPNKTIDLGDEFFIHPSSESFEPFQRRLGQLAGVVDHDDRVGENQMPLQNK